MKKISLFAVLLLHSLLVGQLLAQPHSVAREWNEVLLEAIRNDFARPTVHARNLFHTSIAMYDIWAAYDESGEAETFLLGNTVQNYTCNFEGVPMPDDVEAARAEAISYAMYNILSRRFARSPGSVESQRLFDALMLELGHNPGFQDTDYTSGNPAAFGNFVASKIMAFGFQDGSNEQADYRNFYYFPVNPAFVPSRPGNDPINFPNR
ncbi:MAG: DUF6851 domain-containing protein, partial [Bacteroidota bacterium]